MDRRKIGPIIDAHAHVAEYLCSCGYRGELRPIGNGSGRWANGDVMKILPDGFGEHSFTYDRLLQEMDVCGIKQAVLMQGSLYGLQNDYSYEAQRRYPSRFVCMGSFDPYCLAAQEIMHRLTEDLGFKGFKFEMSSYGGFMGFHPDFLVDGKIMEPVWQYATQHSLVMSFDIGSFGNASFQLDELIRIAKREPGIAIVIEHLFCPPPDCDDEVRDALKKIVPFENIYMSLANLPRMTLPERHPYPSACRYVSAALEFLGSERLLWGSDLPTAGLIEPCEGLISYLLSGNLFSESEAKLIFRENAARLYKIHI